MAFEKERTSVKHPGHMQLHLHFIHSVSINLPFSFIIVKDITV